MTTRIKRRLQTIVDAFAAKVNKARHVIKIQREITKLGLEGLFGRFEIAARGSHRVLHAEGESSTTFVVPHGTGTNSEINRRDLLRVAARGGG